MGHVEDMDALHITNKGRNINTIEMHFIFICTAKNKNGNQISDRITVTEM
jgi:hypothetical protein